MEVQAQRWQRSLDSLTATLLSSQLSPTERTEQIAHYRDTLGHRLQASSQLADQELLKEVNNYLQKYGKMHNYDFILGATEGGNIVYAKPRQNLTQEVIQGLNQDYDKQRSLTTH